MNKVWISTGVLVLSTVCFSPMASLANPFGGINRVLNGVNGTVNGVNGTVNNTTRTIDNLNNILGIDGKSSNSNSNDSTKQVLDVYETWYKGLSTSDQEMVSWLVMEYARDNRVTFNTISKNEWFLQKNPQEQKKAAALFFKVNEIFKAAGNDKDRFLAFAFCVNTGGQKCN